VIDLDDESIYKRVGVVNFSIPRTGLTTSAYSTLLGTIKDRAGTINNAAFDGYNEGQVFFHGHRGGTYKEENGAQRWQVELIFTARLAGCFTGTSTLNLTKSRTSRRRPRPC
jgi:hypothetical protein